MFCDYSGRLLEEKNEEDKELYETELDQKMRLFYRCNRQHSHKSVALSEMQHFMRADSLSSH